MKSCNALQGALSDFLQTVIHLSFFIVNKSSSYQTTTKQTHFTKLQRYTEQMAFTNKVGNIHQTNLQKENLVM